MERRSVPPLRDGAEGSLQAGWPLAFQDDLTGLHNRRLLSELLGERWGELVTHHGEVTLILIDLDSFKEINDTYGHLVGDEVLKTTARLLEKHFRTEDLVIRYGGDEFVVVLPGAGGDHAGRLAERARKAIESHPFVAQGEDQPSPAALSFSMGVASCPADSRVGEKIFELADQRLYAEKRRRQASQAPRPRGRRVALGAVSVALAGIVVALFVAVRRPGGFGLESGTRPPGASPRASEPPRGSALAGEREAELEAYVRELEGEVESLRHALDQEQPSAGDDAYEATVRELQEKIQSLQEQIDSQSEVSEEATDVEGQLSETATDTTISVRQERPLISRGPPAPNHAASKPGRAGGGEVAPASVRTYPVLIRWSRPSYPVLARRSRKEARVRVRVVVDETGRVVSAKPLGAKVGFGFDESACAAALEAVYKPGTLDGVPVTMETVLAIRFEWRR